MESEIKNLKERMGESSRESPQSINSHITLSLKKFSKKANIPNLDLTKVSIEESEEDEEDIDKMIESAIEMELENNPDIANEFENMEDFKRYIFDKYFHD